MAAGNLEPISLDDSDVEYDEYVGVLEGGITNRSERMLSTYTDLETRYRERFEEEVTEEPSRHLESSEDAEAFHEELAETYEEDLYPALSGAGEEDIGSYEAFQDTMRTLSELNYVKFLAELDTARSAVSKTRNHSSNSVSLLNEVGEILTEKGYTHSTKEPIKQRFNESKKQLKRSATLRKRASATVKSCYFYLYTAILIREKYDIDPGEFQYVDLEESLASRLDRVREVFVKQDKRIRKGRRSLKQKMKHVKDKDL